MSSLDCSIKHSFYQKGLVILFKNVFMLPLPVISKVKQYKETKTPEPWLSFTSLKECVYLRAEIYKVVVSKSLVPPPHKTRTQTSIKAPEAQNRIEHLGADSLASVKRIRIRRSGGICIFNKTARWFWFLIESLYVILYILMQVVRN